MNYENDFVDEKPVEINIDGRIFLYKPVTGGDENGWLKDIMGIDPETKMTSIDWGEYNKKKISNILSVPYDDETITKILGTNKTWANLNLDEKFRFLGKLKAGLFDKLITAMKKIDEPDNKALKN